MSFVAATVDQNRFFLIHICAESKLIIFQFFSSEALEKKTPTFFKKNKEIIICNYYGIVFCVLHLYQFLIHLQLRIENVLLISQTVTFHSQQTSDSGGVNL